MLGWLDFEIIKALQKDARVSFSDLAKELQVPPGKVRARFRRLKKAGLIKGSTLILDRNKIGLTYTASIGVKAVESDSEEVMKYINGLKLEEAQMHSWIVFGRYNISTIIDSKNLIEIHKVKLLIKQHPSVKEVTININNFEWANCESIGWEKMFKR